MNNIYQYIIGQTRYILYSINPKFIRLHIREQVGQRRSACSPVCLYEARCCGCKAPNVFFAPKGCRLGSYPSLMNKGRWKKYRLEYDYRMALLLPVYNDCGLWPFSTNIYYIMGLSAKQIFNYRAKHLFSVEEVEVTNSDINKDSDFILDLSHLKNVENN